LKYTIYYNYYYLLLDETCLRSCFDELRSNIETRDNTKNIGIMLGKDFAFGKDSF